MAWVAAAIIGSSVVGGVLSSNASSNAADAQVQGAQLAADASLQGTRESNALIKEQFDTNRADQMPWMTAGRAALDQQSAGVVPGGDFNRDFTLADFQKDPGLAFRMEQGRKALEGSAAARGQLLGGGTLKALTEYGQNFGSQEYGNAYNRWNADRDRRFSRLSAIAGTGQATAQQVGSAGATAAGQQSSNIVNSANERASSYVGSGNAQASGIVGSANAINTGIGNAVNGFQTQQFLNTMRPQQQAQPYIPAFGQTSYEG